MDFHGKAERLKDQDLPRAGALIGVGEDELHAFMDVEAAGSGFDSQGRPKMLFEPHIFYRELGPGTKRDKAVKAGLAYSKWGAKPYPKESYTRLAAAMKIDSEKALRSASWGLFQILGKWHKEIGYDTALQMVLAFADSELAQLESAVNLLKHFGVADELSAIASRKRDSVPDDWRPVAKAWNGAGYEKNNYHKKMAEAHNKWRRIRDTPLEAEEVIVKTYTPTHVPPTAEEPKPRGGVVGIGLVLAALAAAGAAFYFGLGD